VTDRTTAQPPVSSSASSLQQALAGVGYVASDTLAMAIYLAVRLGRPLLLAGEAGVGKTEIAHALS